MILYLEYFLQFDKDTATLSVTLKIVKGAFEL